MTEPLLDDAIAPQGGVPPDRSPLDLDPDEMRRLGYAVIDALVERQRTIREGPPWRGGSRRELEPLLREPCPEGPRDADAVLERALTDILPRAGRIDHPRFFAFVPASPTWASILGDLLATGFNIFQGTWLGGAGPSQIELVVLDWFREWLGMPEGTGGLFTSGGSAANLCAVVAARDAAGHPERPAVYFSDQSHSSVERACRIAGFRESAFRRIASDEGFRLDPAALEAAIRRDRAAGLTPVLVSANGGATNTGAVDPLPELADLCAAHDLWLHVDAAYGGFGVLTEQGARALAGIERAHSVTLDPHKWLFQPFETGCLLVRDPADLERAFRVFPEYLQDTDLGYEQVNFADRGLQLTRAFRALKVWMAIQMHGRVAHARAVARGIELGDVAEGALRRAPGIEILSPASLGIVCFRVNPEAVGEGSAPGAETRTEGDGGGSLGATDGARNARWTEERLEALNQGIQETIVAEGTAMMSSTRLRGRYALRLCILNFRSTEEDVLAVVERIVALGRERAAVAPD